MDLNQDQFGPMLNVYRKNLTAAGYNPSKQPTVRGKPSTAKNMKILGNTMRGAAMQSSLSQTGGSMFAPPPSPVVQNSSAMSRVSAAVKNLARSAFGAGKTVAKSTILNPAQSGGSKAAGPGKKSQVIGIRASKYAGRNAAVLRAATGAK